MGPASTPAGAILDGTGIPIGVGSSNQTGPDLAFDGVNYLVVWQGFATDADVRGARGERHRSDPYR